MPIPTERSSNRPAILLLSLFLLISAVTCIWTLGRVKDAAIFAVLRGGTSAGHAALATLGPLDFVLLFGCAISGILIWLQEVRNRSFSRLITTMSAGEATVVLTVILAWTGQCYLYPGVLLGGDTATHISRLLEVAMGLREGHLPLWTNYQYLGEPLLGFTGPFFYVVGGVVTFALGDPTVAAKVILLATHMTSGWLFYLLLRRFEFSRLASMVPAICYSSCFAILHLFLFRGVFPQAFTIVFLITIFYSADGLLRTCDRVWADTLIFALSTAAIIVNHQPHALFAALYLFIFGVVAVATGFWPLHGIHRVVIAGVLGVITSTVAVLPTIVEANWVMIEPDNFPFSVRLPSLVRLGHLLLWKDVRTTWGYDYWAYLGLGLILGPIAGLYALGRGRLQRPIAAVTVAATACLVCCFFIYNPTVRDVLYLAFFAGLLSASGLTWLQQAGLQHPRWILGAVSLVLLDILSTAVQPVARTDKDFQIQAGVYLHRVSPNERVIQIFTERDSPPIADMGPDNSAVAYEAPLARIAGNHNMAATHVHNYLMSVINAAITDLRTSGRLRDSTHAALAMLDVNRIVCHSSTSNGCPASYSGATHDPTLGRTISIADSTPVIFSHNLVLQKGIPGLEKPMLWDNDFTNQSMKPRLDAIQGVVNTWVSIEKPDLAIRQGTAIPVKELPDGYSDTAKDTPWHPDLESYSISIDTVLLRIRSDMAGYVQLAYPWYPGTKVTVNGQSVKPIRGMLDLIVVAIPAGDATIELAPVITSVERISMILSLGGLALTFAYAILLSFSRAR